MRSAADAVLDQRSPRAALWCLFGATTLVGAGMLAPPGTWTALYLVLSNLALGFLPFLWYCRDSDACDFKRNIWWNMGMVALLVPTVFVYLWRTRARGRRMKAIGKAIGCGVLLLLASGLGMGLGLLCSSIARHL